MGQYLIPLATDTDQAANWSDPVASEGGWVWQRTAEGVLVAHPTHTDAEIAALFAGYAEVPGWQPIPQALRTHAAHLVQLRDAIRAGQVPTNAQVLHVLADIIDWIRLREPRL